MKSKVIKIRGKSIFYSILGIIFLSFVFQICIDQVDPISFETKQIVTKAKVIQTNASEQNIVQVKDKITTRA